MATLSSTLAWKIPWTEEPGRLQSMGSLRVGHDWATSLSLFTFMHWRRNWQPTPVFLPGESQGWRSLMGCCLWVAQSRTRLSDWTELKLFQNLYKVHSLITICGFTNTYKLLPFLWFTYIHFPFTTLLYLHIAYKDPDAGKDWRQEEKGTIEDETVGWHYWLNGHKFERSPGDGKGQGSLVCCSSGGHRVRHNWATEQ